MQILLHAFCQIMSYHPVSTADPSTSQGNSGFHFDGSDRSNTLNSTWEYLRKEARSIEQQIDNRLISYSQAYSQSFSSSSNLGTQSNQSSSILIIQQELNSLLTQLERITNEMKPLVTQNSSYNHLYSRHIANLYDYNKEFNKTRVGSDGTVGTNYSSCLFCRVTYNTIWIDQNCYLIVQKMRMEVEFILERELLIPTKWEGWKMRMMRLMKFYSKMNEGIKC